jgi:hypothetical protein
MEKGEGPYCTEADLTNVRRIAASVNQRIQRALAGGLAIGNQWNLSQRVASAVTLGSELTPTLIEASVT